MDKGSATRQPLLDKVNRPGNANLGDGRLFAKQIVRKLEEDLAALEEIAQTMYDTAILCQTDECRSIDSDKPSSKVRIPPEVLRTCPPAQMPSTSGYDFVFNLPLPSATTDEQDEQYKKHILSKQKLAYPDLIRHAIISPSLRDSLAVDTCGHLREAQSCVIGIIMSFFETLSASLNVRFEHFRFASEDYTELFICIRICDKLAEELAQMGEYSVELSASCLASLDIKLSDPIWFPAHVNYEYHMKEDGLLKQYEKPGRSGEFTMLRQIDIMRLTYDKVTDYINLSELQRVQLINQVFLCHDKDSLQVFVKTWANFHLLLCPGQPIDEIRDYFGEGIAFYFLFLGFLARGLLFISPVALLCQVLWFQGSDDVAQCIFCFFMLIWATVLLKLWRRTQSYYANKWGTDYTDVKMRVKDEVNPNFHGEKKPSPIDENIMILQPDPSTAFFGRVVSVLVTVFVVLLVIVCVCINQWFAGVEDDKGNEMAGTIGAIFLSVQIKFWDKLWDKVIVDYLVDLEQHVTQYAFDQARVAKTFAFKFINTFFAFFYIAYVQEKLDPKGCAGSCKDYLVEQLAIVFLTYITFGIVDMGLPYVSLKLSVYMEEREAAKHGREVFKMSLLEQQSKMLEYSGRDKDADYLQSLFPIAFVMLFGTMMPGSVYLAFLALASQIRTHAWKLVMVSQRPFPSRQSGIGIWDMLLNALTYISLFNCIGLVVTQVDSICDYVPFYWRLCAALGIEPGSAASKLIVFFIFQNAAMIFKLVFDVVVSDATTKTSLERMRQEIQRVRVSERGRTEIHEQIGLRCSADVAKSGLEAIRTLKPGDDMYVEPLV